HKKVFDGDKGPNTGGMGAFSPSHIYDKEISDYCMKNIFLPTVLAMNAEDRKFKGVLYFGLIVTKDGVFVIEYNCRFGDPETQAVLPRLQSDIVEIMIAIINEKLDDIKINWDAKSAACVVMASGGYPGKYQTDYKIRGLSETQKLPDVKIYHSGTKKVDGEFYTSGGRVLGVTALGDNLQQAINKAYKAVENISFDNVHYRKDIGKDILKSVC
ncbi:MAG: phosphoribosylamine--glycine ligase, partial [Clostridiaceae bacterium]|nr:phosphoribosylamine--glycine ligase [Clostridiaceae bacterium]